MVWVSLGLYPLHFVSFLGWVLLGQGPFLLQFDPCFFLFLVYGPTSIPATPLYCFCHVTTWLVLTGPAMYFSFIQFMLPSISTRLILMPSWAPLTYIIFLGILDSLHSFGHPWPIPFLHSHGLLLHFLGFSGPITISFTFGGLLVFTSTPFTNSFFWAPPTHFSCFSFLIILMSLLLPSLGSLEPVCFL